MVLQAVDAVSRSLCLKVLFSLVELDAVHDAVAVVADAKKDVLWGLVEHNRSSYR